MTTKKDVSQQAKSLRDQGVKFVRFEMPCLMGMSKSKTVPIAAFEDFASKGLNIYGGTLGLDSADNVIEGTGIAEEVNYTDGLLVPDLDTLKILPWKPETAAVVCAQTALDGVSEFAFGPRAVLVKLIERAADMGLTVTSGLEYEFYLMDAETREPLFEGLHIFQSTHNHYDDFLDELLGHLIDLDLGVITHNAEYGPGQYEINFSPETGVSGADKAFRYKNSLKEIARRSGLIASFMSKPDPGLSGCGCHIHVGLVDSKSGENMFMVEGKPDQMSEMGGKFTAGVLHHARALTSFLSPTPNCYHRLKPHTFAPSRISWGSQDRTAMVRGILTGRRNSHIEVRSGSGMTNPYLGVAAVLSAGLLGLKNDYDLPPQSESLAEEDLANPLLAQNLDSALDDLDADSVFREALGEELVKLFSTVKRAELDRFHGHVTDWEINEYQEHY
jgi:glutamine synthetase